MFETTSDMSVKDHRSQAVAINNQSLSLPNIPKKPASRGEAVYSKDGSQKQKLVLPSLYYTDADGENIMSIDRDKQNYLLKNKTAFAKQVKQRLNLVLGEMPHAENAGVYDEQNSDDADFEEKINQNKEIIKMHKMKKENQKNGDSQRNKIINESKSKRQKKPRNQSLYEKRVKQYRDQSTENKYLQKKKQTIKQQNNNNHIFDDYKMQDIAKQIRSKEDLNQMKGQKNVVKKSPQKRNSMARVLSQRSSHKNLNEAAKNDNLFDCIQNYLENPHESKKESGKNVVGLTLLKAKRDIEDKIKAINQKLGIDSQQKKPEHQRIGDSETARDWRRIQIGSRKIDYHNSNFDKELERIGSLQERNSLCLEKYLQQQKFLLQLELRKNELIRKNANSH